MAKTRFPLTALVAAAWLLAAALPLRGQLAPPDLDRGGNGLGLALRRLGVTARVLYVTAHPDDEHNGVLVRLARGLGLRTALLTLTRGEGGQNAIGPELGEALGVLRTEELSAVHRLDGVEQYFGGAYEFGFSFSLEETFTRWDKEKTLADVVRVVRRFRPDVILTMPMESAAHQHHPASAQLAREAFRAAADPARFKEQIDSGLRPWQARKIYEGGVGGGAPEGPERPRVKLDTGLLDPLLGLSAQQLGLRARASHRSQVYAPLLSDPVRSAADFLPVDAEPAVSAPPQDLFDGIDLGLRGLLRFVAAEPAPADFLEPGLLALEAKLREANSAYDARAPQAAVRPLAEALAALRKTWDDVARSRLSEAVREELLGRLDDEEREITQALALALGVMVEARLDEGFVVPGESTPLTVSVFNPGASTLAVDAVEVSGSEGFVLEKTEGEGSGAVGPGERLRLRYRVAVGPSVPPSRPYWRREGTADRYRVTAAGAEDLPWSRPDLGVRVDVRIADTPLRLEAPAIFRYDGGGAEKQQVLQVRPALSLRVVPSLLVLPQGSPLAPRRIAVTVTNHANGESTAVVRLRAPAGFSVTPREAAVQFQKRQDEATVAFVVTPPRQPPESLAAIDAVAVRNGTEYAESLQLVAYPHVEARPLLAPAQVRLVSADVKIAREAAIGYVGGSSGLADPLPDAIRELGLPLTWLGPDELPAADLARFSTVVVGIRAYEVRPDLRRQHARLMSYVEGGGNLLVLYQRGGWNAPGKDAANPGESPYAPWPAVVTTRRLTDESAPMEIANAASALLTSPNRIGPADFDGWIQERAIQLLEARDPRYLEVLQGADPFPKNAGTKKGLLVETRVGKGTWTYTGLSLFRQLPAGVPGAYRIWANLLSRPRGRSASAAS